ncbi:ABC transporter substrate-binding protein [Aquabacter sp. P-9]|uniref:ABC transporter substrate-binding protein n=1 Tax=Aquabacter sediminis TaxID=3029197 RepID=UPI00237E6837|nr:ABC transporter substrate-binding protein [Aquabacter sp. P-9]MDE1567523.1 ABC transporter substrate-binding protein [Aquabacter sp. P-9]
MTRLPHLLLIAALAFVALWPAATVRAAPVTLVDIVGRKVTLPQPAQRIVLAEGRQIITLALISPDPVSLVAGWSADLRRRDPATYGLVRAKFPKADDIPLVGEGSDESFSVEKTLALSPDLVVLSGRLGAGRPAEMVRQFEAAGIPVVFVDFFAHPFENTLPSLKILGQALGREEAAQAYADFYAARMKRIGDRLAQPGLVRPKVLMEAHAGGSGECCNSPGRGSIGDFIAFAGGTNIATDIITGTHGRLSLEYVLRQDPSVYVATGGPHLKGTGGLVLGPGFTLQEAQSSLASILTRPGIAELQAVMAGNVHGLFHNLVNLPLNVLVAEALAKWIHPDLFPDLDPNATLAEINARFLAVPFTGTYWVDLKP